jgi:hypothetical protein
MRTNRTTRTLAAVATVALLAGACNSGSDSGGGGGGDTGQTVSAQTFVDTVCGELLTWITSLQDKGTAMQEQMAGVTDPAQVRDALVGYLDDAVSSTQQAAAAIGEAGAPDVENGEQISAAIIGVLDQVEQVFTDARQAATDLPNDPAGMQAGAAEISTQISTAFSENPLADIEENEELNEAASNSEQCQEMEDSASMTP